jgi:hypothetical protein
MGAVTLEEAERDHIRKTLEQTRWVVAGPNGAAARLGIKRSTLYFRMQKLGISRPRLHNEMIRIHSGLGEQEMTLSAFSHAARRTA